MDNLTQSDSVEKLRLVSPLLISLRTFCDIVAAGLTTVLAGIFICGNSSSPWLTTFVGLTLFGGVLLLLTRAPIARIVAMATHTLAITLMASLAVYASCYRMIPANIMQVMLLVMLFPLTMLTLLTVDHYFVTKQTQPTNTTHIPLRRRLWRAAFLIASALMLMTCVGSSLWLASPLWTQWQSRTWEYTEATIIKCELLPDVSNQNLIERVNVQYEYEVDGKRHFGSRFNAIPPSFNNNQRTRAESITGNITPGSKMRVAYNPKFAEESMLFPGVTGEILLLLLACCFYFFCFPAWFYYQTGREGAWLAGIPVESKRHDYWSFHGSETHEAVAFSFVSFSIVSHLIVGMAYVLTTDSPSLTVGIAAWTISITVGGLSFWFFFNKAATEKSLSASTCAS